MELRSVEVDHTLREAINYPDSSFPVDIWTDDYNGLVDATLNCHWHSEFEYGVMLSGELDYYINGAHRRLQKGDGVFINSNTMHMATQCVDCHDAVMFTIVFPPSLFTGGTNGTLHQKYFQPILKQALHGFVFEKNALGDSIIEKLEQIYAMDAKAYGYELQCLALLCGVWSNTLAYLANENNSILSGNANPKHEQKVKDLLSYIHAHYSETISIDDMARVANISRSECFRCFKRFTNKKPVEYINEYRLAHAASMLKETGQSIAEICTACGFSSSSYFGKLFREKYTITPTKYRQNHSARRTSNGDHAIA